MAYKVKGEQIWSKMEKVNSELFSMTYGALVVQMLKDYEDVHVVNTELEKMGFNMGIRLVDELLSKAAIPSCSNFRDTAEIGFKMFLGVTCDVLNWSDDSKSFSLTLSDNPFADFVELLPQYKDLIYCNILCGVLRGALEMVQMKVECDFVKDMLKGDDIYEIRVTLKEILSDNIKDDE